MPPLNYETLLATGVTLVMAGIIGRGFAAQTRRDLARRRQHRLDERKSGEALLNADLDRPPGWFERNAGLVANVLLVLGLVVSVAAFVRR